MMIIKSIYSWIILNEVMLFTDQLNIKQGLLRPELDRIFEDLISTSQQSCDLHWSDPVLISLNGKFDESIHANPAAGLSPYTLGVQTEGFSHQTHYEFIHAYRTSHLHGVGLTTYLELHRNSDNVDRSRLEYDEKMTIQMEMLLYLKIWEGDLFIKQWYQILRLLNGENYNWHFKIAESNRVPNATGVRHEIIRIMVRDRLANYPNLQSAIRNAYLTQIRNSIGHSNYFMVGRTIDLNNRIPNDPAHQLRVISFNEWIVKFHDTMIIYDESLRLIRRISDHFITQIDNNNQIDIRINRETPQVDTILRRIQYFQEHEIWRYV